MVDRYERGESYPPVPILRTLANRFGVSVEFLMGWDHSDDPDPLPTAA
jgi:transcriptional regulator with XRE-family HTH domain